MGLEVRKVITILEECCLWYTEVESNELHLLALL